MTLLNEDLILEYLIENLSHSLSKKYGLTTIIMLDYCYKSDENIPQNYLEGFVSNVLSKKVNSPSKQLNLDESEIDDCLFLESYKRLLSDKSKNLIKYAKTANDFKIIVAIDMLSKKVKDSEQFLDSHGNLESKVFNLARSYEKAKLGKELKKDIALIQDHFFMINEYIKKPLSKKLIKNLCRVKKELKDKSKIYSKSSSNRHALEIHMLIHNSQILIDNRLKGHIIKINKRYDNIQKSFADGIWDNVKRINTLSNLSYDLENIKSDYKLISCKTGIKNCNSLSLKINGVIDCYNHVQDLKEEFKEIKNKVMDDYKELKTIFEDNINSNSVRNINNIYHNLKNLAGKSFPDYVPENLVEDYYSSINKTRDFSKQKCIKRIQYLINKSSAYRKKVDKSFISWRTEKFAKRLEEYNHELEVWSKCQIT